MKFIALFHSIDLQFITRPTYFVNRIIIYIKKSRLTERILNITRVFIYRLLFISAGCIDYLYIIQELPSNFYKYIA